MHVRLEASLTKLYGAYRPLEPTSLLHGPRLYNEGSLSFFVCHQYVNPLTSLL